MNRNERRRQQRFSKRVTQPANRIAVTRNNIEHFMIARACCEYAALHNDDFYQSMKKYLDDNDRELTKERNNPEFFHSICVAGMNFFDGILENWLKTQPESLLDG